MALSLDHFRGASRGEQTDGDIHASMPGFSNSASFLNENKYRSFIEHLPLGVTELYCHPATARWDGADALPAHYRPVEEFRALVSPAVKAKLAACNLQPQNFRAACGV